MGHLLTVDPSQVIEGDGRNTKKPKIIVVLDVSASMGPWVQFTRHALHDALLEVGFDKNDPFVLITFTHVSTRIKVSGENPKVRDLKEALSHINAQNTTCMAGAIPLLKEAIEEDNQDCIIVALSDGHIMDQVETVNRANQTIGSWNVGSKSISTLMIRLVTSHGATPDTRALACIGSFGNSAAATINDVTATNGAQDAVGLMETIREGLNTQSAGIELSAAGMRRLPHSEVTNSISICTHGNTSVLLENKISTITLGGQEVPVEDMGDIESESNMMAFLEFVERQLKMWVLMGNRVEQVEQMLQWVKSLQKVVENRSADEDKPDTLSLTGRSAFLKKQIEKRTSSILARIAQLANCDRVSKMNAQQQADWLRAADPNSKAAKALAKRTQKCRGNDEDFDEVAQRAVRAWAANGEPVENDDAERSFYSMATASESIRSTSQVLSGVEDLTVEDSLTCVGGIGVPFEAYAVGDYPDPYNLRIKSLFSGQWLAEPDLWTAVSYIFAQSEIKKLECPGHKGSSITGVISLRSADKEAYEEYVKQKRFFELQASAQIRHMVAPVPWDTVALNAAGIFNLLEILGVKGKLTHAENSTLTSLLENIDYLIGQVYPAASFKELYDQLASGSEDPRPWLVGDILYPITVLLRFHRNDDRKQVPLSGILRGLHYLDCYNKAKSRFRRKHDKDRQSEIIKMLGIDIEKNRTELQPFFKPEPEPDLVSHYSQVEPEKIVLPDYFSTLAPLVGLKKVISRPEDEEEDLEYTLSPLFAAVAAVQALQCRNLTDRVDAANHKALIPDPKNESEALAFLSDVVRKFFEEDYEVRVKEKAAEEAKIETDNSIQRMLESRDLADFLRALRESPIVNRQHFGYPALFKAMVEKRHLEKLAVLLSGRDIDNPEEEVWSGGNFERSPEAEAVLCEEVLGSELLAKLLKIRKDFGYRYRKSGKANRQGHNSDFPSFYALGFESMKHMKSVVSEQEYKEYMRLHAETKGCCKPRD